MNTGRGALIDARDLVEALKSGKIGGVALDVYEEEEASSAAITPARSSPTTSSRGLLTFPNVVITGHQAYFTEPALRAIAETTVDNVRRWARGEPAVRAVQA